MLPPEILFVLFTVHLTSVLGVDCILPENEVPELVNRRLTGDVVESNASVTYPCVNGGTYLVDEGWCASQQELLNGEGFHC